jgi:hypothetical protein
LFGSAKLAEKLLGPTCEYVGGGIKTGTDLAIRNLARIFNRAIVKLGHRLETPGGVPPRVLAAVLASGAYCEDPLAVEYFAGVLASSRSTCRSDDRALSLLATVSRLSTYQIRAHYLLYTAFRRVFLGSPYLIDAVGQIETELCVPMPSFDEAMAFGPAELLERDAIYDHILHGFVRERLIGQSFMYGDDQNTRSDTGLAADAGGIIVRPEVLGAELFLAAMAVPYKAVESMFSPNVQVECPSGLPQLENASKARS